MKLWLFKKKSSGNKSKPSRQQSNGSAGGSSAADSNRVVRVRLPPDLQITVPIDPAQAGSINQRQQSNGSAGGSSAADGNRVVRVQCPPDLHITVPIDPEQAGSVNQGHSFSRKGHKFVPADICYTGCFVSISVSHLVRPCKETPMSSVISFFQRACMSKYFASQFSAAFAGFENPSFLRFAASLVNPSFHPNPFLVQGNPCYDKFQCALTQGLPSEASFGTVFHGTARANINQILRDGLDPDKRRRQLYGPGEYFTRDPYQCLGYAKYSAEIVVFVVVLPRGVGTEGDWPGKYILVNNNLHQFPIGTMKFEYQDLPVSYDPPNCVCSWKSCRAYQTAFQAYGHPLLDGVVRIGFIQDDKATLCLKESVDRVLNVSDQRKKCWKSLDGGGLQYEIARHHFTEPHIQRYCQDPERYSWTSPFSESEAKQYLSKLDPNDMLCVRVSEPHYVQCPNVSEAQVQDQLLRMRAEVMSLQQAATARQSGNTVELQVHGVMEAYQQKLCK